MNTKVIMTIDDIPQNITRTVIDCYQEMNIPFVMFGIGQDMEKREDDVIYALSRGVVVGNHTYTHPHISELSYEEGIEEIEKTEEILNRLYEKAGVERKYKLFRFPFIDKGGENKDRYQKYLREHGFMKIDDTEASTPVYLKDGHKNDIDVAPSIDLAEYMIRPGSGVGIDEIYKYLELQLSTLSTDSTEIVLMHTHDETEEMVPGYYKLLADKMLGLGLKFTGPEFISLSET